MRLRRGGRSRRERRRRLHQRRHERRGRELRVRGPLPHAGARGEPAGPTAPGPDGGGSLVDPAGGAFGDSGALGAGSADDGSGVLAALTSGKLPLTGLPLLPVLLAALAALGLAVAFQRRRMRQTSRA